MFLGKTERIFVSPLARKYAKEKNIPLDQIKGSGSKGRILIHDVEGYKPRMKYFYYRRVLI